MDGFEHEIFSFSWKKNNKYYNELMDAFDFDTEKELEHQKIIFNEGYELFSKYWGFKSKTFIAPCYIWHPELENIAYNNGVRFFQGLTNQFIPKTNEDYKYKIKYHFIGQQSKTGVKYLTRNCYFEPSVYPNWDWINLALSRIALAFKYNKPAILSSHRLNFIGSLFEENRKQNLATLKQLLSELVKRWPEVEFMSSSEVGDLIDS